MAKSKLELTFEWENNVNFEVKVKETTPGEPVKNYTVVNSDENNHISATWPALADVVERYMKSLMAKIGKEMLQP